jgi:hypothetical protein
METKLSFRFVENQFPHQKTAQFFVYSTEVVELLLNFTAMEFMATLDGSAFEIASKGFLGSTLAKKTAFVFKVRYSKCSWRRQQNTLVGRRCYPGIRGIWCGMVGSSS